MTGIHIAIGFAVFSLNLAAGAWGVFSWLARRPSAAFWYALRTAQGAVVVQTFLGVILLIAGHEPADDLHILYGALPLVVMLASEAMRVGAAQHVVGDTDYKALPEDEAAELALDIFIAETRVVALGSLIIAALALRAGMTAGFIG